MWDQSNRWQRGARTVAGAMLLAGIVTAAATLCGSLGARRLARAASDLGHAWRSDDDRFVSVSVPAELGVQVGNLVYQEQAEGAGEIIGRVVEIEPSDQGQVSTKIELVPAMAAAAKRGGVLLGTPPTLTFEEAARLLMSPDAPGDEAVFARDAIWPSVEKNFFPAIAQSLQQEAAGALAAFTPEERALFAGVVSKLHTDLQPLEADLFGRLAHRSWRVIGLRGIALGIWRETTDVAGSFAVDWWSRLKGSGKKTEREGQDFLSDETKIELRDALVDETRQFWTENRDEIIETADRVLAQSIPEFEHAFRTSWGPRIFEQVIVPSWQASEGKIVAAVEEYAADFTRRRLITPDGGPRLALAHALRSGLGISDAPLLVFVPSPGETGKVIYQPLVPLAQ